STGKSSLPGVRVCLDLDPAGVASESEKGLLAVQREVAQVPDDLRSRRPEPSVWSVNAYAAHLDQAAGVISGRVVAIASEDRPLLQNHDQDAGVERVQG